MKGVQAARKSRSGIPAGDDVVFIGGIPRGATQGEMREYFKGLVGCVAKVRFVIDHGTRHHKGYGFARFGNAEVARQVVELSRKGLMFKGKLLNVGPSAEDRTETESAGSEITSASSGCEIPPLLSAPIPVPTPTPALIQSPFVYTAAAAPNGFQLAGFPQQQVVFVQAPCQFVLVPTQV